VSWIAELWGNSVVSDGCMAGPPYLQARFSLYDEAVHL